MYLHEALKLSKNVRLASWDDDTYITTDSYGSSFIQVWLKVPHKKLSMRSWILNHQHTTKTCTIATSQDVLNYHMILSDEWEVADVEDIDWSKEF